jgi:outer membrane biosynthesis protein TonB
MVYRKRIAVSAGVALVVHGMALALAARVPDWRPQSLGTPAREEPIVIDLAQPPDQPRRFVDAPVASAEPPEPTDRIAERQARAADAAEGAESEGPRVARVEDFDALGGAPVPAPPAPKQPAEPVERNEPAPERETAPREPVQEARVRDLSPVEPPEESPPPEPQPAPAPEQPAAQAGPPGPEGESAARVQGNVAPRGVLSFEAHRDEIAPYLADVRRKVEAQWRATLQMRYTGTGETGAVLDCSIRPDGTLAGVRIVDPGDSPTYAGLCKQAIERAAPFGRFPFEVPAVYRSENLEIRWTFSFR